MGQNWIFLKFQDLFFPMVYISNFAIYTHFQNRPVPLIVLFLAFNRNKPYYNILNSLGAMIFCFIKLTEIYLGKWLKWRKKIFRSYFRQYRSQYFYIKNIALYCIWSHLSFAVYFLMFWDNQSFQNIRWKNFIGHFIHFPRQISDNLIKQKIIAPKLCNIS